MTIDLTADIIDIQELVDRYEELTDEVESDPEDVHPEDHNERELLADLLSELEGEGGDVQHNGIWYPQILISDDHFEDYAKELAEDCGMVPDDASWPNNCIDWEKAATELQIDYTSIDFNGVVYWYR